MNTRTCQRRGAVSGFTLMESILVIGLLGLASAGIMKVQRNLHSAQDAGRDQVVAVDLMRACAERLLAVRREVGYAQVTSTVCNNMAGIAGFATHPDVTLTDDTGSGVSTCATTYCTATVKVTKSSGPAQAVRAVTLRLYAY